MRVVVTGGAGFIGANLVADLVSDERVDQIVVFDDLSTGDRSNVPEHAKVTFVEASILDERALAQACRGAESIVHLGAIPSVARSIADPVASHRANVTGTVNVLEAARRTMAHVLVASSSSVYGANLLLPKREDQVAQPLSPYAAGKLAAESYALAYGASYGLEVLALRFFNVYGPLQRAGHAYAAVVPAFVAAAIAGAPLTIHGDGLQTRDFTYVGTVTRILRDAAVGRVVSTTPVNLAFGSRTSLLELIELIEAALGHEIARHHVEPRVGDVRDSQADNSVLRSLFPDVTPTPLREGLRATIDWMRTLPDQHS